MGLRLFTLLLFTNKQTNTYSVGSFDVDVIDWCRLAIVLSNHFRKFCLLTQHLQRERAIEYRICRSISRSSSTITTRTPRGVRLMYRMCCIIQRGSKYNTSRHVEYSTTMASKRASYTAAFKVKVIKTAENCGNRAAGREYSVNEKLVRDWRKKKAELEALPRGKRSLTILSW